MQAQAFCDALPDRLTEPERVIFDTMYRKQPCLGHLPLIVLHERFDFLRKAILEVWDCPQDPSRMGVVLRMLQIYGEMTSKRREGDRRYKKQIQHRNLQNRIALKMGLDADFETATEAVTDEFQELAGALQERRGASCTCRTTHYWHAHLVGEEMVKKRIVLHDECERCGHHERVRVTRKQLREAAN